MKNFHGGHSLRNKTAESFATSLPLSPFQLKLVPFQLKAQLSTVITFRIMNGSGKSDRSLPHYLEVHLAIDISYDNMTGPYTSLQITSQTGGIEI